MLDALLIAGNSFVGRYLWEAFRSGGVKVRATARNGSSRFVPCDLTDAGRVEQILDKYRPRWIVQCAGGSTGQSREEMDRLHVGGTKNLLKAVKRLVPEAGILLFGSAAEYGPVDEADLPVGEDYPARPQSDYGQSKLAQMQVAKEMAETDKLRVVVVRPFNLLGPGLPGHYLASALIQRLRAIRETKGAKILPVANGQATRDFVDVRDAAAAVAALMRHALPKPGAMEVFNIASGTEVAVLEVAQALAQLAGGVRVVDDGAQESRSQIVRSCGDARRLKRATGWQASIPWRRSLHDMWWAAVRERSRSA